MVCIIDMYEKPKLDNPVLIEGLPGIGFVANIATLHLIRELRAVKFADIRSSSFQDLAVTTDTGGARSPTNELFFHKNGNNSRDLIFWYGNTQALTTFGQYELCGQVLDTAQALGCRQIITLGGFRQEEVRQTPQVYCAATDLETFNETLNLGAKAMVGQIYGVAGISIGLASLKGFRGFSLLVETPGTIPDAVAARVALNTLTKYLKIDVDLSRLDTAAEETKKILESFGLIRTLTQEKKREEQPFKWFI